MPRHLCYQFKVLVQSQNCQTRYFGEGGDEKIRDRWSTMLTTIGQQQLHLNRAIFYCWGEVLHWHQGKWR
ncbi:hypothetical protein MNVI_24410 [Mycobacterium noviomagense]|uniref:Uncharacterized protein n=1 Tax=Mycobacterium noviomagense TaxID=459858 RepID=A0A7I7PET3_9MYCO|nr:hypothetical protein MNVI_24410 [Mycobacterium noviomagense]